MQRSNSSGSEGSLSRLKNLVPFYAVPASRKTSAEIISEARVAVGLQPSPADLPNSTTGTSSGGVSGRIGMKPVSTKRPFTPREKQRTLFGPSKSSRPSSSTLSLSLHVEEEEAACSPEGSSSPPWGVRLPSLPIEAAAGATGGNRSTTSAKVQRGPFRSGSLTKLVEEQDQLELGVVGTAVPRRKASTPPETATSSSKSGPSTTVTSPQQPLCAATLARSASEPHAPPTQHPPSGGVRQPTPPSRFSVKSSSGQQHAKSGGNTKVARPETTSGASAAAQPLSKVNPQPPTDPDASSAITFDEVLSLINVLKILSQQGGSAEEVEATLRKLYSACERAQMLGRRRSTLQANSASVRSLLLRTLFLLVERDEHMVLLQLARLLLALQVLGPNLAAVCKLVFKVSRSDQNDKLFLEDNILELLLERLGGASLVEDAEASVYGYGALKFVTMEPRVVARVLQLGGLELMVLHMKLINLMAQEGGGRVPEQALQALFQLTGALRHVAGEASALPAFVTSGALTQLCRALQLFASDPDLMSNVARTLSIASTHESCCDALVAQPGSLRACVSLLEQFPRRQDLVVRLSYALGNVMARSEHARRQLLGEESSRASVLAILGRCWAEDQATPSSPEETSNDLLRPPEQHPQQPALHATEDVLVKVLRVVANASLSESVGPALADCSELLAAVHGVLAAKRAAHSEELVLGALLTLNNLSFYPSAAQSLLASQQLIFAEALVPLLDPGHPPEATIETLRVFGNLTRWKETRDFLAQQNVGVRVLELLGEKEAEMQYVAAGVLVNLMADPEAREDLRNRGAALRLASVLQQQGEHGVNADWELTGLACQALWNCCADLEDLAPVLKSTDTETLVSLLADLLDDERLFGVAEGSEVPEAIGATPSYQQWEEFASVATNLLERLETVLEKQQEEALEQASSVTTVEASLL